MESLVNQHNLENSYKGKKVFVTGHTGFKGAWLITWLNLLGADIKGYALEPESAESIYNIISPHIPHVSIIADIRDKGKLEKEIASFDPDYIFHLAAQALVRRSYNIPSETFEVNVIGTANLLESVMHVQKKCATIIITTDKVYENKEQQVPYTEKDRLGGHDPYSASKACAEIVAESFSKSFFTANTISHGKKSVVTARAGNVIGGGDWSTDRIVPDIIRHLKSNEKIPVRHPDAVRPWQHVLEPLGGYLVTGALLNDDTSQLSGSYNFGPDIKDHLTVRELVDIAIDCWGNGEWQQVSDTQWHEAGILKLDIGLALKDLRWHPKLNSKLAVKWTIDWYKQEKRNLYEFTLQQIKNYQSL